MWLRFEHLELELDQSGRAARTDLIVREVEGLDPSQEAALQQAEEGVVLEARAVKPQDRGRDPGRTDLHERVSGGDRRLDVETDLSERQLTER